MGCMIVTIWHLFIYTYLCTYVLGIELGFSFQHKQTHKKEKRHQLWSKGIQFVEKTVNRKKTRLKNTTFILWSKQLIDTTKNIYCRNVYTNNRYVMYMVTGV